MSPIQFPQANCQFGPPKGLDESQVMTIPAFRGVYSQGNLDGADCVIVAWKPDPIELARLVAGQPIYLMMMGGLAPHCLTTEFPSQQVIPV